jgi:DNA invertase Pin-like site-specific DNA recombinase
MAEGNSIRAVAYYRTSTTRQEASIDEQRQWAHRVAPDRGVRLVNEFEDFGVPGDEVKHRPGLRALFRYCEEENDAGRPVAAIVVWDRDRFSRADSITTNACIYRLMEAGVSRMLTSSGWVDWSDPVQRTMGTIDQEFGKQGYVRSLSKNVARSCLERARKGQWTGGRYPYGYTLGPDKHLALAEAVKHEAVRWAFRTYLQTDTSLQRIAADLEARAVPPPDYYAEGNERTRERRSRRPAGRALASGRWTVWNVEALLTNPAYTGAIHYPRTHKGKYHTVRPGEPAECRHEKTRSGKTRVVRAALAHRVVTEGAHPALVDAATFEAVQRKLRENRPGFRPGAPRRTFEGPFAGLLCCGGCGAPLYGLTAQTRRHGKLYEWRKYACSRYLHEGRGACSFNAVPEALLLEAVADGVQRFFSDTRRRAALEKETARLVRERRRESTGEVGPLSRRLGELDRQIAQLFARLARVPEELVDGLSGELQAMRSERAEVHGRLEAARRQAQACDDDAAAVQKAMACLGQFKALVGKADPGKLREVMRSLFERIEVHFRHEDRAERRRCFPQYGLGRWRKEIRLFGAADMRLPMSEK